VQASFERIAKPNSSARHQARRLISSHCLHGSDKERDDGAAMIVIVRGLRLGSVARFDMSFARKDGDNNIIEQQIIDEIERLKCELSDRQTFERPVPSSVVRAYHELIERQYDRLDLLKREAS
jgi:hypothetical protein